MKRKRQEQRQQQRSDEKGESKLVNGLAELYDRRQAEFEAMKELERDIGLLVEQAKAIAVGK